ncbi:hypothetical protein GCM10010124_34080 [Pilimelia terevasa]|uniref:Single-stranded DNA-binding protein n=1 Tax=Pilimelia terevasa TaxID=53372 RepID=A0A8J3FJA3_9ACTN|nr:single-stranded DNA-binding protein [Pilimelia terevasa]GGK38408.1 hypothetical protein GCM10010124_34080 [Pilimelia terevasa]
MFDTYLTITGNVLVAPTWRRTQRTQALVANFKVASTSRRFDRETGAWVDGDSLRVRVNCWRRLAEGVAASVMVGDPVVVVGRLYTRDWTDADGVNRTTYELEAVSVGHDLARGRSAFTRNRPVPGTSEVAGPEHDGRVRGESALAVPPPGGGRWVGPDGGDGYNPGRYGGGGSYARGVGAPEEGPVPDESPDDAVRALRGGGFAADGRREVHDGPRDHDPADADPLDDEPDDDGPAGPASAPGVTPVAGPWAASI